VRARRATGAALRRGCACLPRARVKCERQPRSFATFRRGRASERAVHHQRPPEEIAAMAGIIDVTDANFDAEVLKSELPIVIDFWAEWCAPCRAIAPIVKDLSAQYDGKVKVVKMNIDENPATPGKYGVRAIPTVLAFKNGTVVGQITGARPRSAFEELVQRVL
jgi:thioredoxin 1